MVAAINPVQPQQQRRDPRESDLDKIHKALQIANAGLGIAVNWDEWRNADKQRALAERGTALAERKQTFQEKVETEKQTLAREQFKSDKEHKQELLSLQKQEMAATKARAQTAAQKDFVEKWDEDDRRQQLQLNIDSAVAAQRTLNPGFNPDGTPIQLSATEANAALTNLIKASGEKGAIDESYRAAVQRADPSLAAQMERWIDAKFSGKVFGDDIDAYKRLAQTFIDHNQQQYRNNFESFSSKHGRFAPGAAELIDIEKAITIPDLPQPPQQPGQAPRAPAPEFRPAGQGNATFDQQPQQQQAADQFQRQPGLQTTPFSPEDLSGVNEKRVKYLMQARGITRSQAIKFLSDAQLDLNQQQQR